MSSDGAGICQCGGELKKTTYGRAWGKLGMPDPRADKDECYQCVYCDMIYTRTAVVALASNTVLEDMGHERKEFGFADGRQK